LIVVMIFSLICIIKEENTKRHDNRRSISWTGKNIFNWWFIFYIFFLMLNRLNLFLFSLLADEL
jgi:hypothetical protein